MIARKTVEQSEMIYDENESHNARHVSTQENKTNYDATEAS